MIYRVYTSSMMQTSYQMMQTHLIALGSTSKYVLSIKLKLTENIFNSLNDHGHSLPSESPGSSPMDLANCIAKVLVILEYSKKHNLNWPCAWHYVENLGLQQYIKHMLLQLLPFHRSSASLQCSPHFAYVCQWLGLQGPHPS